MLRNKMKKYFSVDCKPLIMKSFTVWSSNMLFTMSSTKAQYIEKSEYLAVERPGYLLFELIPLQISSQNDKMMDWDKKKSYALGVKQIGNLLNGKYNSIDQESQFEIQQSYTIQQNIKKTLSFQKQLNQKDITIQISNSVQSFIYLQYIFQIETSDPDPYSMQISIGDFITIRELASFSLPFLLGWNALYSSQTVAEEIRD